MKWRESLISGIFINFCVANFMGYVLSQFWALCSFAGMNYFFGLTVFHIVLEVLSGML